MPSSTQHSKACLPRNLISHLYMSLQNVVLIAFFGSINFVLSFWNIMNVVAYESSTNFTFLNSYDSKTAKVV